MKKVMLGALALIAALCVATVPEALELRESFAGWAGVADEGTGSDIGRAGGKHSVDCVKGIAYGAMARGVQVVETRLCAGKRVLEFAKRQALTTRQSLREVDENRYGVVRTTFSP